jgi:adenylate kinase family enzyme
LEFDHLLREGIKQRAKLIQQNCEFLLVNIHRNANQFQLPERVRFEYIRYLSERFNEEVESEKALERLYDRIERMQYTFHQKLGKIKAKHLLA